jgi:hypothetical protein
LFQPEFAMTDAERNTEILALIERYTRNATKSKAAARKALIKTGVYTKSGKLSARYGGKGRAATKR